ncbi:MAG: DEAD/DEAH box helicase, partial [Pseudomonadota bacterium]
MSEAAARIEEHGSPADLVLRDVFGFEGYRPGQQEIVEAMLAREDVLAIMPTGGGKSLCYQLPAIAAGGLTLVVSPLVALMEDQV